MHFSADIGKRGSNCCVLIKQIAHFYALNKELSYSRLFLIEGGASGNFEEDSIYQQTQPSRENQLGREL